jgi:hypothetical protein
MGVGETRDFNQNPDEYHAFLVAYASRMIRDRAARSVARLDGQTSA